MKKLKLKILKYFVLCSFGISVGESIVNSLFDDFLFKRYATTRAVTIALFAGDFLMSFILFFIGAFIFYHFVKNAVKNESNRQIQEQNLIYSCIAHDLKTPMTSVQGFARALNDGKISPHEQAETLSIIYRKSCHMNDLIETLSAYSKLSAGNYLLNPVKTNLCTVVRDSAAENYEGFEDKEIELEINIPDEEICCLLDHKEFRRAVDNLIINAYKHNCKGTSVMIKVCKEKNSAFVIIADNGEKIPEELAKTMFDPFVCGNASRTSGNGSGLGLAICKKIINMHGGKLYLSDSVSGYVKGFIIEIPV